MRSEWRKMCSFLSKSRPVLIDKNVALVADENCRSFFESIQIGAPAEYCVNVNCEGHLRNQHV